MHPFVEQIGKLGAPLLRALDGFDKARRWLHPPHLESLRAALAPLHAELEQAAAAYVLTAPPEDLQDFARQYGDAAASALRSLELFCNPAPPELAMQRILAAMHEHCVAQELLYPLRVVLPPVSLFFLEPAARPRAGALDPTAPTAPVGILHTGSERAGGRGGFSLYVPENYDAARPWPLVVALHGGSGSGRDFLWTWLREARSRGFLLLSPSSRGSTWSLLDPEVDHAALLSMVAWVRERWHVATDRILLTGLSDGATYALLSGLREQVPYSALAPVSGVFHPANLSNGNLDRARGCRIYLVHGALDWMFPVQLARSAAATLQQAGADLVFREIDDLSHTYPREENDAILRWFDPSLALPQA
jgi:phospholipase/carboxylesterase